MKFYNHNLRANIQEWKNRLTRASGNQFIIQLKAFHINIQSNKLLLGLINEASVRHKYESSDLYDIICSRNTIGEFENSQQHAAFAYQLFQYCIEYLHGKYTLTELSYFSGGNYRSSNCQENIINWLITPIVYFLHDQLDEANSVLYILERYKRRVEWFTRNELKSRYDLSDVNFEKIFEDDLRLFLFDQGIDYPFSTPSSSSGRADLVANIDSEEPVIVEIKILDKRRKYGKERIRSGLQQIIKYTEDYNKDFGYLVIYNLDEVEVNFDLRNNNKFPPFLEFNGKHYYFIVVNCNYITSASKKVKVKEVKITEQYLIEGLTPN